MALLWMDGFDHYGSGSTGRDNMTNYGAYAAVDSGLSISNVRARTGTYSLRGYGGSDQYARRVFGAQKSAVGFGCAVYMDAIPSNVYNVTLCDFWDVNGYTLCRIRVKSDGSLQLWRGSSSSGSEVSSTSGPVMTAGGWYHFECKFTPNGATSSIEVRVNEVTVLNNGSFAIGTALSGDGTTSTETSSVRFGNHLVAAYVYVDDLFAWDTSGSYNTDFIGDRKVATLMPNGDTSVMDWTPDTGSTEYTQIDEIGPDGDTSYVYVGAVSNAEAEFDLEAMPSNAGAIAAVQTYVAARKTDAGTCDYRTDIVSGGLDTAGDSHPITTSYLYYMDVFETDPNTGAQWTKSGVDSAKIRLVREA